MISVFFVASREVSSHFASHTQKHAGSVVCVYDCIPSLDLASGGFLGLRLGFRLIFDFKGFYMGYGYFGCWKMLYYV